MFHLVYGEDALEFGVLDNQLRNEGLVERDVNVLVDRGGNEKSGMLAIVRRQVGPTASKGDSKRRTRDNHGFTDRFWR